MIKSLVIYGSINVYVSRKVLTRTCIVQLVYLL